MKIVLVVLLGLASSCWCDVISYEDVQFAKELQAALDAAGVSSRILEQNIAGMIENAIAGIPRYTEHGIVNISVAGGILTALGTVDKVNISGLDNHVIDRLKFAILPIGMTLHVGFDDVQVRGLYDIDGLFGKIIPLYGNGDLDVGATDFSFYLAIDMTSKGGYLIVKNLAVEVSVGAIRFRLGNFLDGGLGQVISELVEENASDYLSRFMYYYGGEIESAITDLANDFLKDKTLQDLIDIISGKTTSPAPTTTPSLLLAPVQ